MSNLALLPCRRFGFAIAIPIGLAFWILCGTSSRIYADETVAGIKSFRVKDEVSAWALDEASGRIFAALVGSNRVVEIDPASSEPKTQFTVAARPTELFIKGRRLVAACQSTSSLYVIDLDTNKVLGNVQLTGKGPYALFGSKADNPYVYAICNTGSAWWDGEVFQVDVAARSIRGRVRVQRWNQSHPVHVVMSDNGRWISPDARGASSPSGGDLMEVDESTLEFRGRQHLHESFGPTIAAPQNRGWVLGSTLYAIDLTGPIRTFAGAPVAVHPRLDLVASLVDSAQKPLVQPTGAPVTNSTVSVVFQTHSQARTLKNLVLGPLVDAFAEPRDSGNVQGVRGGSDPYIRFDAKRERLVVTWRQIGYIVDLKKAGVEAAPALVLEVPSQVTAAVGTTIKVPLALTNPELKAKTTLEVVSGPDGAAVRDNELVWSPTAVEAGLHKIVVGAKSGDVTDRATIEVRVGVKTVDLGMIALGMAVDARRPRVVLWGQKPSTDGQAVEGLGQGTPSVVVVVDTEQGRIITRRLLHRQVRGLVSIDGTIFYTPTEGAFLYRLSPNEPDDAERVFLDSPATFIEELPGSVLSVVSQNGKRRSYNPKTLQPIDQSADGSSSDSSLFPRTAVRASKQPGGTVWVDAQCLPPEGGEPICLSGSLNLPTIIGDGAPMVGFVMQGHDCWSRRINGESLVDWRGNQVTRWNNARATILTEFPVVVVSHMEAPGTTRTLREVMEYRDLIQGNVLNSQVIGELPASTPYNQFIHSSDSPLIAAVQGTMAVVRYHQLYLAPIPLVAVTTAPVPVHFDTPRMPLVTRLHDQIEVKLKASGGKGALTYALARDIPGVSVDRTSGTLRISPLDAWKVRQVPVRTDSATAERNLPSLRRTFRDLTGKPLPAGTFPYEMRLTALARDDEGQQGSFELSTIVLVPREEAVDTRAPAPNAMQPRIAVTAPKTQTDESIR